MSSNDKKLLSHFKETCIDKILIVGKLYKINNISNIFTKTTNISMLSVSSKGNNLKAINFIDPIFVLKIKIVESIDYFNIGPAILITCLQGLNQYHLYVFPKQLKNKKDFNILFSNSFEELL